MTALPSPILAVQPRGRQQLALGRRTCHAPAGLSAPRVSARPRRRSPPDRVEAGAAARRGGVGRGRAEGGAGRGRAEGAARRRHRPRGASAPCGGRRRRARPRPRSPRAAPTRAAPRSAPPGSRGTTPAPAVVRAPPRALSAAQPGGGGRWELRTKGCAAGKRGPGGAPRRAPCSEPPRAPARRPRPPRPPGR